MKPRTIEKQLFKIAALLVIIGAFERIIGFSENAIGMYFILAGHIVGVVAIFMYMKYVNDTERENQPVKDGSQRLHHK